MLVPVADRHHGVDDEVERRQVLTGDRGWIPALIPRLGRPLSVLILIKVSYGGGGVGGDGDYAAVEMATATSTAEVLVRPHLHLGPQPQLNPKYPSHGNGHDGAGYKLHPMADMPTKIASRVINNLQDVCFYPRDKNVSSYVHTEYAFFSASHLFPVLDGFVVTRTSCQSMYALVIRTLTPTFSPPIATAPPLFSYCDSPALQAT